MATWPDERIQPRATGLRSDCSFRDFYFSSLKTITLHPTLIQVVPSAAKYLIRETLDSIRLYERPCPARGSPVCNLYSIHTTQEAMRRAFEIARDSAGNV